MGTARRAMVKHKRAGMRHDRNDAGHRAPGNPRPTSRYPGAIMPRPRALAVVAIVVALVTVMWLLLRTDEQPGPYAPVPMPGPPSAAPDASTGDAAAAQAAATQRVEAAAATSPTTTNARGSLRVLVQWPPDHPAADVAIYLREAERLSAWSILADGVTSAVGIVQFDDLPLGKAALLADRGDTLDVTVTAGAQEVTFTLQDGVTVQGTVTDPAGAPVAGAGIWLQAVSTAWTGGREIARADSQGAFALQHINPTQSLGAIAQGFAPSKLVDLDTVDSSQPPAIVDLQLQPGGGQLVGTVTDADGRPIAAAVVAAGARPRNLDHRGSRVVEAWTQRVARTDADGRFALAGLADGRMPVAVRKQGFGIWRDEVEIQAAATTTIRPQLLRAAVLSGTVTDGDGKPLAEAVLRVYDKAPRLDFIASGQIDFDETFGHLAARTDAAGHYRVAGVTPGVAFAFAQQGGPRRMGRPVAYTSAELEVAAGADVEWNPVVTDGRTIEGVVLYADGQPMPTVFVTLTDERTQKQSVQTNDEAGVFRFVCLEASTYAVRVQYWDAPKDTPTLQQAGLVPDRGRIELRAPFTRPQKLARGNVTGRIDDAAGRLDNMKAATVTLQSDKRWFRPGGVITDGAFRFDDVEPCRFRLMLMQGETAIAQSDWFELQPAASLDTGVLRTTPGGAARIHLTRLPGAEACAPRLYLKKAGFTSSTKVEPGRAAEIAVGNLTAGDYELSGSADNMMALKGNFTVAAGETTEVHVTLRAGALCRFEVWFPEDSRSTRRSYRVTAPDGTELLRYDGSLDGYPRRPCPLPLTVPNGEWTLEVSTDDGLTGKAQFSVRDLHGGELPRIDLK